MLKIRSSDPYTIGKLKSVLSAWSFWHWGIDIVGILPTTPSRKRYTLVATDYFAKWIEAEAYNSLIQIDVINSFGRI